MAQDTPAIPEDLLAAYSEARLTRRELADRMDRPVGFGELLAALQGAGLPLPRFATHQNAAGAALIRRLSERAAARGA